MRLPLPLALPLAAMPLALLLSACGSAGGSGVIPALFQSTIGAEPPPPITEAELAAFPYPLLLVRGDGGWQRMVLQSVTSGPGAPRLTWLSASRRAMATVGGRIVAAAGGGTVLAGTLFQEPDPLLSPLSIPADGAAYRRTVDVMEGSDPGSGQFGVPLDCRIAPRAREVITIVNRPIETLRLEETCRGPGLSFTSRFWAATTDGFIWRAEQWAGGDVRLTFEVLKPPPAS